VKCRAEPVVAILHIGQVDEAHDRIVMFREIDVRRHIRVSDGGVGYVRVVEMDVVNGHAPPVISFEDERDVWGFVYRIVGEEKTLQAGVMAARADWRYPFLEIVEVVTVSRVQNTCVPV